MKFDKTKQNKKSDSQASGDWESLRSWLQFGRTANLHRIM